MTKFHGGAHVPGTMLLRIARLLFNDHVIATVVQPTIADLQREVGDAASRRDRLGARWRGYGAFWTLAVIAPFAPWPDAAASAGGVARHDAVARLAAASIVLALLAAAGPALGWLGVVVAAGGLFAIAIHAWYRQHPSDVAAPAERMWRAPQINFSSTDVPANIGGLIFVVGSVFIVAVGLPTVFLCLFAATIAGCFLAWWLAAWRTRHPKSGLPENLISLR